MPFAEPETAGGPYPRDLVGHLLMVWPVDYITDAPSKFSRPGGPPSDVIVVDFVDLDEVDPWTNEPGAVHRNAWWRPGRLIGSLKRRLGSLDPVLAWMSQGVASQGFNAPFELISATSDPAAVARAKAWLDANPDFQPTGYAPKPDEVQEELARQAQPANPNPQPEVETSQSRIRSDLERMAAQAQRGADRLPDEPTRHGGDQPTKFPY